MFDPVGRPTLRHDLEVAATRGLLVSYGSSGGAVDDLDPSELGEAGSLYLTRPRLGDHLADGETIRRRAAALSRAAAAGTVGLTPGKRYALEDAPTAHRDLEERTTGGKSVLDIAAE